MNTLLAPTLNNLHVAKSGLRNIDTSENTQGNIDNNHIYLRSFIDNFPSDAVGGSSKAKMAIRKVSIDWGDSTLVTTDIDGKKKFFRKRGWVGAFFAQARAKAGEMVSVDEVEPYSYRVSLIRR